ncbi:manganese efflux pump [Methylophaga pinxianii]|nr:manganese efflux pump MntP family protein [Methylophaga pinxianii]
MCRSNSAPVGQATSQFIVNWGHWIAFTLLLMLGLQIIY